MILRLLTMLCVLLPAICAATPVIVGQKDKAFTVKSIDVKVGDTVRFQNQDPFFHNVFSLSDASFFDLGSFPKGDHRDITLNNAGVVEVECAIHPSMKMTINVKD